MARTSRNLMQFVTVASGSVVSDQAEFGRLAQGGLFVPAAIDKEIFVQASWDTTSANFARVQLRSGSGDWSIASRTTALAQTFEAAAIPFEHFRVELGAASTDTRTFCFVAKFR